MPEMDRPWGGAIKIYTTARESYNRIVDSADPHKFSRIVDAFHASAALAMRLELLSPEEGGKREELLNVYSIDPDGVLWAMVSSLHLDASGSEKYEMLMKYADAGIRRLAEEFEVHGNLQAAIDGCLR